MRLSFLSSSSLKCIFKIFFESQFRASVQFFFLSLSLSLDFYFYCSSSSSSSSSSSFWTHNTKKRRRFCCAFETREHFTCVSVVFGRTVVVARVMSARKVGSSVYYLFYFFDFFSRSLSLCVFVSLSKDFTDGVQMWTIGDLLVA